MFGRSVSVICLILFACAGAECSHVKFPSRGGSPEVYFSPHGGAAEAVVRELNAAKESVPVQAYSFTSAPIAKALVDAKRRGLQVTVIFDKSNRGAKYSSAEFLAHAGIPTYTDARHAIAHNKVIIIDSRIILTGSLNFTKAAENSNAENLLILHNRDLAQKYIANFQLHLGHSELYLGR